MSPEQARGRPLDKRTDIWSFGCVVYECLTGSRPFEGETTSDLIARILERDPEFDALPGNTPPTVRNLLVRCLEKDPRRRLRDIGDALIELEEAINTRAWSTSAIAAAPTYAPRRRGGSRVLLGLLLFIAGALSMLAVYRVGWATPHVRQTTPPSPVTARLTIDLPTAIHPQAWALSPDGRTVAWAGRAVTGDGSSPRQIYLRRIDDYATAPLPATRGVDTFVFAPDSSAIIFSGNYLGTARERIARVPLDGSAPPTTLCDWNPLWRSWGVLRDGRIVAFQQRGRFYQVVPSGGGRPSEARPIDFGDYSGGLSAQSILPTDDALLVSTYSWENGFQEGVGVVDLASGTLTILTDDGDFPRYHEGTVLFTRSDTLFAAPFDSATKHFTAAPRAVLAGIRTANAWDNGDYALSTHGTLAYAPGGQIGRQRRVIIVDREGRVEPWNDERRSFEPNVAVAPDGNSLAVVLTNVHSANYELWITDSRERSVWRYSELSSADFSNPSWSPDGARLTFHREGQNEADGLYVAPATDINAAVRLIAASDSTIEFSTMSWSPDGRYVLASPESVNDTIEMRLFDTTQPNAEAMAVPLPAATQAVKHFAARSPDGRWLAYGSTDSGTFDIKLCAFDKTGPTGPSVVVTRGHAGRVRWSRDSAALYWLNGDRLFEAKLSTEPSLNTTEPEAILDLVKLRIANSSDPLMSFDVLPDGRFILVQKGDDETDITQLRIILNWTRELKRRIE